MELTVQNVGLFILGITVGIPVFCVWIFGLAKLTEKILEKLGLD